jgi:hypothetical protein
VFRWPTLRLNGYPETTSYNYMMSSNHKVLPLGKHKLGITGNQESLGIPGNRETLGMPRGMGNAQAIGNTGNAGECVCMGIQGM